MPASIMAWVGAPLAVMRTASPAPAPNRPRDIGPPGPAPRVGRGGGVNYRPVRPGLPPNL